MLLPLMFTFSSYAFDAGLTATQAQEKVQNQAGSEDGDPISYGLVIGHVFDSPRSTKFSPKLGYIKNEVNSDDHYSGKYKIETIYLLYDVIHPLNQAETIFFRAGIGNFIKRIKGDGGTVTIPNGAGFATAYKPGKTQESYTSTLNIGADWIFMSDFGSTRYGMTLESFWSEILDSKKRMFTVQFGLTAYF